MYLEHFGLRQSPFTLTPDTRFFVAQASHREALNMMLVALRSGEGFLKLIGEIGLGKTILCRKLLNTLGPEFVTAYIPNPAVTPQALYRLVAEEFGRTFGEHASPELLLQAINTELVNIARRGQRAVLVVDEAQALPDESLEGIRLLTNLETETYKLLHVVLFGQPELDARLAGPQLRQLRQRIVFSHRLRPLDEAGFLAYVRHRLQVAGLSGDGLFERPALRLLFGASGGVPRLINILCHKALLAAYGPGRARVMAEDARAAIEDTEGLRARPVLRLPVLRLPVWMQGYAGLTVLATALGVSVAWLVHAVT